MNKLIKLTKDHYVVVDDSEIKHTDWYLDDTNQVRMCVVLDTDYWKSRKEYKKITHSTQPLDDVQPLDLSEIKELTGEVDVEKKAEYDWMLHTEGSIVVTDKNDWKSGFHHGYNQALEDNKEKKYTEEDLRNAYRHGTTVNHGTKEHFNSFIQSFQSKTEWEVEIVDGKFKLKL